MTADLQMLRDVPVVPVTRVHQHIATGGPIWPAFDRQTGLRHCRNGLPVDQEASLAGPSQDVAAPCVWGGFIDLHFGHFMAEHLPRLPFAVRERPDDAFLFTVAPGGDPGALPDWVWAVLDWVGLDRAQVRFVTIPLHVATLRAGVQAETLPQVAPDAAYLDLLDTRAMAMRLRLQPADLVYVTRAGLPLSGGGGTAGEGYLTGLLAQSGLAVLDPATASLPAQMAVYAGARHLVFAEGSALHGRQLLGRVPQRITVLRRRRGRSMARAMLTPRVTRLDYLEVSGASLVPQWKNGTARPDPALSLYDLPALFAAFARWGVDLAASWDADAYRAAAQADIAAWIPHHRPTPALIAQFHATLAGAGLAAPAQPAICSAGARPGLAF